MNSPVTDVQPDTTKSSQSLESSLRKLWEKIKSASELIQQLRYERQQLKGQVLSLEEENASLRTDIGERDLEMKRLRAERQQLIQAGSNNGFTDEEKDILKGKIKDLIAKINSHL